MDLLLYGKEKKFKMQFGDGTMNLTYAGIIEKVERAYVRRDLKTLSRAHPEGGGALHPAPPLPACAREPG